MTTVRLTKYQQQLLCDMWKLMPPKVRAQLPGDVVRDVELTAQDIAAVTHIIAQQREASGCKNRRRRLDALLKELSSTA